MNYHFWLIYDWLKAYKPVVSAYHSEHSGVKGIRLYCSGQKVKEGYLYLADIEEYRKVEPGESDSCNWLIFAWDKKEEIANGSCLMCVGKENVIYEVFSFLQEKAEQYHDWYQRILQSLLGKNRISAAIRIAAEQLENPIAIFDSAANLVDWCGEFRGNWKNTIWEEVIELGYAPADFYTFQEHHELTKRMIAQKSPVLLRTASDPQHTLLAAGIIVEGELAGSFGMADINVPFTQGQIFLLEQIRGAFQIAYRNSEELQNLSRSAAFYFERMLRGETVDEGQLREYFKHIGWRKDDISLIVYFSFEDKTDGEQQYFLDKVRYYFEKSILCNREKDALLLLKRENAPWRNEETKQKLISFLEKRCMRAIVSSEFVKLVEMKQYFEQCKEAEQILKMRETAGLFFYPEIFQEVFAKNQIDEGKRSFCCHPLLENLDLEEEQNKEWLKDLYAYLLNGKNLAKAAKQRYVHRNSFLYRIHKMEEYLHLDFEMLSPSYSMYLLLSCMLLLNS